MKLRMPSIPLITIDPYFSVWSYDELNKSYPTHWTGSRNAMLGTVKIDDTVYRFLGEGEENALKQVSVDADAFSTYYVFEGAGIKLTATFTSPLLIDDLYYASRPVSYLHLTYENTDGNEHTVTAKLCCSEELVLNKSGEGRAIAEDVSIDGVSAIRMGKGNQKVLWRSGDDVRIDWGYFYLGVKGNAECKAEIFNDLYSVSAETELSPDALFLLAYDDIDSIVYFGENLKAYWKKGGKTIEAAISESANDYNTVFLKCQTFSNELSHRAEKSGGEEYAEMLLLAYRQVMAGHKLVVDKDGNNLYISKECFSNGCAATVDVTYPSSPLYLLYNTELLKAMLRPIFKFAESAEWEFNFAPHDVGTYPILNGQVYGPKDIEKQMPVEECGNMLILVSAICRCDNDYTFAKENLELLSQWSVYLEKYGKDPENQLCTDDFAGHMPHNVNLAIKAVMGLVGFSDILSNLGEKDRALSILKKAKEYAHYVCRRAENSDGSLSLSFDSPETFSLKYNAVWDIIWKTEIFPKQFFLNEFKRCKKEMLGFGVPLDSRSAYTKSDWQMWVACFADSKNEFNDFIHPLYNAYNTMHERVPMGDWYYADISKQICFKSRTVQGGLFIKLLLN